MRRCQALLHPRRRPGGEVFGDNIRARYARQAMNDLPEKLFADPVWSALDGPHQSFRVAKGEACRYPADVAPFAAVASPTVSALADLRSLLEPDESVWVASAELPRLVGLGIEARLDCLQMVLPREVDTADSTADITELSAAHASEMVALTDLAFPGFFRARTYSMGSYCGMRRDGELIAMGGERLKLSGYSEISGVCTHPGFRGKGLATRILWYLAAKQRREGVVSWLHVTVSNSNAIELYRAMGFRSVRTITLTRIVCKG